MVPRRDQYRRPLATRRLRAWDERKTDLEWIEELLHGTLWAGLAAIQRSKEIVRDAERSLIRGARRSGWSWDAIADITRRSRQSVYLVWKRDQEGRRRRHERAEANADAPRPPPVRHPMRDREP